MSRAPRTGFVYLVFLFLRRMPTVWIGGFGAAVVGLLLRSELGPRVAAAGALAVVTAAVGATISIDRRRGLGRRMLFRGPTVSARRVAALVLALVLIVSVTTVLAMNLLYSVRQMNTEELQRRSAPPSPRRGTN